jgi:hypothetical protein
MDSQPGKNATYMKTSFMNHFPALAFLLLHLVLLVALLWVANSGR